MNTGEAQPDVLLLASSLCAGGAAYAVTRYLLLVYNASNAEGRRIEEGLVYDAAARQTPLPRVFQYFRLGMFLLPLVRRLRRRNWLDARERMTGYEVLLVKAGFRPYLTPDHFATLIFLWMAVCGAMLAAFPLVLGMGPVVAGLFFLAGAAAGLVLPHYELRQSVAERAAQIEKRLPYAAEFVLLAMEANASLPTALNVYCREIENDPLADELRIVVSDVEKGLSTQEALAALDRRVRVDLLSSFILAVNTGLATGQPITDVMRTQATATRRKRYESAEEIAKKASTKATFPLIVIVVAVLVLLIAPLMINFSTSFF
jgi:pilus assembly protein TadC